MEIWLDAHISPFLSNWIEDEFSVGCNAVREMHLRDADDLTIFSAAKQKRDVVIMTKDNDFRDLLNRLKSPPKILWLSFGNCSNQEMKEILIKNLPTALSLLEENDIIEISR